MAPVRASQKGAKQAHWLAILKCLGIAISGASNAPDRNIDVVSEHSEVSAERVAARRHSIAFQEDVEEIEPSISRKRQRIANEGVGEPSGASGNAESPGRWLPDMMCEKKEVPFKFSLRAAQILKSGSSTEADTAELFDRFHKIDAKTYGVIVLVPSTAEMHVLNNPHEKDRTRTALVILDAVKKQSDLFLLRRKAHDISADLLCKGPIHNALAGEYGIRSGQVLQTRAWNEQKGVSEWGGGECDARPMSAEEKDMMAEAFGAEDEYKDGAICNFMQEVATRGWRPHWFACIARLWNNLRYEYPRDRELNSEAADKCRRKFRDELQDIMLSWSQDDAGLIDKCKRLTQRLKCFADQAALWAFARTLEEDAVEVLSRIVEAAAPSEEDLEALKRKIKMDPDTCLTVLVVKPEQFQTYIHNFTPPKRSTTLILYTPRRREAVQWRLDPDLSWRRSIPLLQFCYWRSKVISLWCVPVRNWDHARRAAVYKPPARYDHRRYHFLQQAARAFAENFSYLLPVNWSLPL